MRKTLGDAPPKTVEEYLQFLPDDVQSSLRKLREAILKAAPSCEEVISYQIPTYKQNGPLVHFAAFEKHCSFFVVNKAILKTFEKELKTFKVSGTTIHFTPANPISDSLVRKIVKVRVAENKELKPKRKKIA